jgi:translation initiation factor RLI1
MEEKIREIVDRYSERGNGNDHMINELCDLLIVSECFFATIMADGELLRVTVEAKYEDEARNKLYDEYGSYLEIINIYESDQYIR